MAVATGLTKKMPAQADVGRGHIGSRDSTALRPKAKRHHREDEEVRNIKL